MRGKRDRLRVDVDGLKLSYPIELRFEKGFAAGGEGVAELGEGFDELLDPFSRGLGGARSFPVVTRRELLGGFEVAEASVIWSLSVVFNARSSSVSAVLQIATISSMTGGSSLTKSDILTSVVGLVSD